MLTNEIAVFLGKAPAEWQREDLLCFIEAKEIHFLNLRYPALDGRLKLLRVPITSRGRAEEVLAEGERVDGSSLFKGIVEPGKSDLYVVPVYATAFPDPFAAHTLSVCCQFMDYKGNPEPWTTLGVLERAAARFREVSGLELRALTELEFYLLMEPGAPGYPVESQRGYHEAAPFMRGGPVIDEILETICKITPAVKYAHAEVGVISSMEVRHPELKQRRAEQFELEFLVQPIVKAGLDTLVAKWVIRNVARRHGMVATFTPKLQIGAAGSGLHVHLDAARDGRNAMVQGGELSETARRIIGGLVRFAGSITAFGNTVASSYLRLVPGQEAPTRVCWSNNNRGAMVREPLGWVSASGMEQKVNPNQRQAFEGRKERQTVELRIPDGSADVLLTLGAIGVAAAWGLSSPEALGLCAATYVAGDLDRQPDLGGKLPPLPRSCAESAALLAACRAEYEAGGVFHPKLIDQVLGRLQREDDEHVSANLASMAEDARQRLAETLMHKDLHRQ